MTHASIRIRGANQNNLKNLDIDLPLNELIVVTGVSGSGKSSLAFDTVYAEGQRRYVETFSPYARQFLDRMDKPAAERVDGIPPAIAIDQTNPVRTSRSTVGTMTELNDHLKLLFARTATLFCRTCDRPISRDHAEGIYSTVTDTAPGHRIAVAFPVDVPSNFSTEEIRKYLAAQGYLRIHSERANTLTVVQDRLKMTARNRTRFIESVEAAMRRGHGKVSVIDYDRSDRELRFSDRLHCAHCERDYRDPTPSLFSFNSPVGACESCRGFGRTMGIDLGLVMPDGSLSLKSGAVKPWQTKSYARCQRDLEKFAKQRGVPVDVPWDHLDAESKRWVIEGEGKRGSRRWYGVNGFFDWLETKAYKMHVRVMLARYRSYDVCAACSGARLRPDALDWRLGATRDAPNIHELQLRALSETRDFFQTLELPPPLDEATKLLLDEIRSRLNFLVEVGLGYLTLDRQSRTLSGGEVQRINLTTALGTSLVNTLFVLDEPSIGLHPRDIDRINAVMRRLCDAGNSLLVVEHDPQIIAGADRILDMGPGPGERGGEIVFYGTAAQLRRARGSLTAPYLDGRRRVTRPASRRAVDAATPAIELRGASEHNLADVTLRLPLNRLVVVTGVSGSGKSTLIDVVLYRALKKTLGQPKGVPGAFRELEGHESIDDVVLVDQSPIGKTTRSNPASFVGAFAAIRKRFVQDPLSVERGYTPGTFSFNTGNGRCPACGGNGFEHVEMQFLSDVYLRCTECSGRRYRDEILEVTIQSGTGGRASSIADVLDMTVTEALEFFAGARDVKASLEPLIDVGLEYLTLGQPVPTLSGGEAQRLKLARHLAEAGRRGPVGQKLFLFDEPTTGLHFQDIEVLLGAFERLLEAGHSIAVIEHNLDVIDAADWIVDLGPEGGAGGGHIVFSGSPDDLVRQRRNLTGVALSRYRKRGAAATTVRRRPKRSPARSIDVRRAREHNLRDIDVSIPRDKFTVITGVSGSGKSTVAFDIVFAEGQRRYLESLNAYARQFVQPQSRPDVDAVTGIPPTVAIEQRTSRGGRKSTVGTMTEIHHFLRLLFVKLGVQHCPDCDIAIAEQTPDQIVADILRNWRSQSVTVFAPLVTGRKGYYTELAKWAAKKGFADLRVDGTMTPTRKWPRLKRYSEHHIELPIGTLRVTASREKKLRGLLDRALDFGRGLAIIARAGAATEPDSELLYSVKRACTGCGRSFDEPDPRLFSYNSAYGWCLECSGTGLAETDGDESEPASEPCPACAGERLNPVALAMRFDDRSIADFSRMPVASAERYFRDLRLKGRERVIGRDILAELKGRLAFLNDVGLSYLTLDRAAPTLSGGEAQRIRLAAQLGSNLRGVCYILDEPTIGLHARDNRKLLATLRGLESKGNTVVVVEHDEDTIRAAEHIIDLGPGAGGRGGEVVASGSLAKVLRARRSLTARMLNQPLRHPLLERRRTVRPRARDAKTIRVKRANRNNLKNFNVNIPLDCLVAVTGVSGSGKSTLVRDVIGDNLRARLETRRTRRKLAALGCGEFSGEEHLDRVLEVDQTPIGKTPRSCPATYVGFFDDIRRLFAGTPESRLRGYGASRFSFNVSEGRCPDCEGQGIRRIEMSFLPDVRVNCDTCRGARFAPETLAIRYRERNIGDVLSMEVSEAVSFFDAHPKIRRSLELMQAVGLGYLTLGQQSPTLSGGEAQRIKLVTELARARPVDGTRGGKRTLYILDEPTIGLHMADVEKLIRVLHRLVDAGHSMIIIEHNLDVVAEADWIVDLGPDGGRDGGRVVYQGSPDSIGRRKVRSATVDALGAFLERQSGAGTGAR